MKLFGENIPSVYTTAEYNILQVENYEEIFFDVFQLHINGETYVVEKVSEYGSYPVVLCNISTDPEVEELYPFVLSKGSKPEIYFNETNISIPEHSIVLEEATEFVENVEEEIDEQVTEQILESIQDAKRAAKEHVKEFVETQLKRKNKLIENNNKVVKRVISDAKTDLVVEFLSATEALKQEISEQSWEHKEEALKHINATIAKMAKSFRNQLNENTDKASQKLEKKLSSYVLSVYNEDIIPALETKLEEVDADLHDKVGYDQFNEQIDTVVSKAAKPIKRLRLQVTEAMKAVNAVNVDIDLLSHSLENKIASTEVEIKNYFEPKIDLLESQIFDISEDTRKAIRELVIESKDTLIEEIRDINNITPVEYIIENTTGRKTLKKDDLDKEIDKKIDSKISNHVTSLRKYIAVYSGGGSVAQQFAAGGTMNGNLVVVGSISASQYLGITGGGGSDVSGLSSNWQNTYTTFGATSGNWQNTFSSVSSLSSRWNNAYGSMFALSANWQNTFNLMQGLSSRWQETSTTFQNQSAGFLRTTGNQTVSGGLSAIASTLHLPALTVRGSTGPGNIEEWKSSAGAVLMSVTSGGNFGVGVIANGYASTVKAFVVGGLTNSIIVQNGAKSWETLSDSTGAYSYRNATDNVNAFRIESNGRMIINGGASIIPSNILQVNDYTNGISIPLTVTNNETGIGVGTAMSYRSYSTGTTYATFAQTGFITTAVGAGTHSGDYQISTALAGTVAEKVRVTSLGNLGVGTTTPNHKATVVGSISSTDTLYAKRGYLSGGGTGTGADIFQAQWDVNNTTRVLADGTILVQSNVTSPSESPLLRLSGPYGNTFFYGSHFTIPNINLVDATTLYVCRGGGSVAIGDYVGAIGSKLEVNGNGSFGYSTIAAPTNGLIVNGKTGIGTSSPNEKFTVVGNISATGNAILSSVITTHGAFKGELYTASNGVTVLNSYSNNLYFSIGGALQAYVYSGGIAVATFASFSMGNNGEASFSYNNANLIINPRISGSGHTVFTAGNVGIGTSSVNEKLTVFGNVSATGTVQCSAYRSADGSVGASGTFTTADAKTVTVKNGIITSIV